MESLESMTMDDRELSLKLLVVLSKTYKVIMDRAVKDMKKYGLSPLEFIVLELLYQKGKFPLPQSHVRRDHRCRNKAV